MRGLRRLRGDVPERGDFRSVIDFLVENLLLLPFLFPAYLVLEWVEAHAGGALGRKLGRVSQWEQSPLCSDKSKFNAVCRMVRTSLLEASIS